MRNRFRSIGAALAMIALALPIERQISAQSGISPEQGGPYPTLLIRNITVIDGSGAPAYGPVNITIRRNLIERVDRADPISAGQGGRANQQAQPDRVIDGTGMYAMPGIVDGHTHVSSNTNVPPEYIYKLLLGHGVTTIRVFNVGNDDPKAMVVEKEWSASNRIVAPRMYIYPFWRGGDARYSSPEGARQIVDEWHAL